MTLFLQRFRELGLYFYSGRISFEPFDNQGVLMSLCIPEEFLKISYDGNRHPQSAVFDFHQGENCQLFAYVLLKHFGVTIPPFRSSQLWEDTEFTQVVHELEPLDLLLLNDTPSSWGAHVAVDLGDHTVIHLSKKVGRPSICSLPELQLEPKYKVFIGAKRSRHPQRARLDHHVGDQ